MDYKYKVFISYRRDDAVFKDTVYNILSEYIDEDKIFVDAVELNKRPNKWFETIHDALLSSEYILICINKDTFNRESQENKTDWYYKEIEIALQRQKEDNSIHIIPIINIRPTFRETRFPELSKFQAVSYRTKNENTTFQERLLKIVGIDVNTTPSITSAPTIINNIVIPHNLIPNFYMLNKLHRSFSTYNCVVVSGIGGSGKTSLAYQFIKEKNFNNIAWVTVNGKIEDAFLEKMAELLYEGEEQERFIQNQNKPVKLAIVKNKLSNIKGKNLLVLDVNTNNETIKQEINTQIYKYLPSDNWKTLVLTRAIVKNKNRFASIEMDRMTGDEAKELFLNNYDGSIKFSDDQLDIIVNELYYHPLLIEQTAIAFSNSQEKDADEVLNNIKENKVKNKRTEEILGGLVIDDKEQQDIYTYLIDLCNVNKLSEPEIIFLACFMTFPDEKADFKTISILLPNTTNAFTSLIEKGVINRQNDLLYIHKLIANVLREQIDIKSFNYSDYLKNIDKILEKSDDYIEPIINYLWVSLQKIGFAPTIIKISNRIYDLYIKYKNDKKDTDDKIIQTEYKNSDPVYISYAHNEDKKGREHIADVVDYIKNIFKKENIRCKTDEDIEGGDRITDFEQKIGNSKYTIIVYNEKYFGSPHCMFEYKQIIENKEMKKIFINSDKINLKDDEVIERLFVLWSIKEHQFKKKNPVFLTPIEKQIILNDYYKEDIECLHQEIGATKYYNTNNQYQLNDKDTKDLIGTIKKWITEDTVSKS